MNEFIALKGVSEEDVNKRLQAAGPRSWVPPRTSWVKLNLDAAFFNDATTLAVGARDCFGKVLLLASKRVTPTLIFNAELLCISWTAELLLDGIGDSSLWVADAKGVVDLEIGITSMSFCGVSMCLRRRAGGLFGNLDPLILQLIVLLSCLLVTKLIICVLWLNHPQRLCLC